MKMKALFLLVLAAITNAQSDLQVTFSDPSSKKEVTVGESLKFVCSVNRKLLFAFQNFIEFVRQPADGSDEVILSEKQVLKNAEPNLYKVTVDEDAQQFITLVFEILHVRDVDEGTLICRVRSSSNNPDDAGEVKVKIEINRPLDTVYLQLVGSEPITHNLADSIDFDSGEHNVKCVAEGSNPSTSNIKLYLGGNVVPEEGGAIITRMDTDVIKYKTDVTYKIQLTVANQNQDLECVAESKLGDRKSVKIPIKIKVYDPKITCNDSDSYPGEMYPTLVCLVDYEGLNIKRFKYELGDSESVLEGQQNKEFVEVERKQITDTRAKVLLKLYKAQDWHFKTTFYLVAEHADGHMTRESVNLRKIPAGNTTAEDSETGRGASRGPGDGSSLLTASLITLIISVWCAFKLSL